MNMSMTSTRDKYMSICCLFVDTSCRHVYDVDMNKQTRAAVKLDQTNPARPRGAARVKQVEANLKEHAYDG